MNRRATLRLSAVLAGLTALAALASLGFGTVTLAPDRVIAALLGKGDMIATTIVLDLRTDEPERFEAARHALVGAWKIGPEPAEPPALVLDRITA